MVYDHIKYIAFFEINRIKSNFSKFQRPFEKDHFFNGFPLDFPAGKTSLNRFLTADWAFYCCKCRSASFTQKNLFGFLQKFFPLRSNNFSRHSWILRTKRFQARSGFCFHQAEPNRVLCAWYCPMVIGKEKAGTSVIRINSTQDVLWHQRKKQKQKTTKNTAFPIARKYKKKKPSVLETKSIHSKNSKSSRKQTWAINLKTTINTLIINHLKTYSYEHNYR